MVDDLSVAQPDLSKSWMEYAVQPAVNDPNLNNNIVDPSNKMEEISVARTPEDNINSIGENVAAQNSIGLLSECMGAMGKLTDECANVVKPQLKTVQPEQAIDPNAPAANNTQWQQQANMDMNSDPGGMS